MKPRALLGILAAVLLAVFGQRLLTDSPSSQPDATAPASAPAVPAQDSDTKLIVHGVVVRDTDGRVAWRGDVDLAPVLARIEAGERDAHRNDGGIFRNREGLLPRRPDGHYREYVIRTPGIAHAGPQRLVIGGAGEVFYTADHYASFQRIR
jgi:filamentous hemagglutinin